MLGFADTCPKPFGSETKSRMGSGFRGCCYSVLAVRPQRVAMILELPRNTSRDKAAGACHGPQVHRDDQRRGAHPRLL